MTDGKPVLIGLCGRSGAGKGYVSALFSAFGIPAIDTDAVYRDLTGPSETLSPCMAALVERFGDAVRSPDGSLNRPVLRAMVFGGDRESLGDLNRISHAFILEETLRRAEQLAKASHSLVLIDAPLLYESGFDRLCAAVVCVTAPEEVLIRRIMARDGIGRTDAEKRLATQKPTEELEERADYRIDNAGDHSATLCQVKACADELIRRYEGGAG